jgi:serine protease
MHNIVISDRLKRTASAMLFVACVSSLPFYGCRTRQTAQTFSTPKLRAAASNVRREDVRFERYCGSDVRAGEVLVKLSKSGQFADSGAFQTFFSKMTDDNVNVEKVGNSSVVLVHSTSGRSVDALLQNIREKGKEYSAIIDYAEPNYVLKLDSLAHNLDDDPDLDKQWGLKKISAFSAWQVPTECCSVVAVIDSGIDYEHEDLKANVWKSPPDLTVQLGGKAIKCPTGSHGFDVTVLDTEPDEERCDPINGDGSGHGTHVAGIIGAAKNNHGGRGVDGNVQIMALKYTSTGDSGCVSDVVRALDFIIEASKSVNVRVVNCSFGFYVGDLAACGSTSATLLAAFQRIAARNILIVASNGDRPVPTSATCHYPSGYALPELIAVTATDESDKKVYSAGYDKDSTQLMGAPGDPIWSTLPGNNYNFLAGTSMATPFVSGAAALVLSNVKDGCDKLSAADLKRDLLENCDSVSALTTFIWKGRRLNVDAAIRKCAKYVN